MGAEGRPREGEEREAEGRRREEKLGKGATKGGTGRESARGEGALGVCLELLEKRLLED